MPMRMRATPSLQHAAFPRESHADLRRTLRGKCYSNITLPRACYARHVAQGGAMRSLLILAEALGLLILIAGVWRVLRRAKGPGKAGSLAAYDQPDATGADYTSDHHPHRHTSGHHHGAHSNSSDA